MGRMGLGEGSVYRGLKSAKVGIVMRIQALFTDKLPQALNEIEIGGIGGKEAKFDVQAGSRFENQSATLVACIVEKEGDWHAQMKVRQLMQ